MSNKEKGKLLSFGEFKAAKEFNGDIKSLKISHLDGKVSGSTHLNSDDKESFAQRMQRISESLEKINTLMADLKKKPKGVTND